MANALFEAVPPTSEAESPAILVKVHLRAGSGRSEVIGIHEDALVVRLAPPASSPRSSTEVAKVLATAFGVDPAAVLEVAGTGRNDRQLRLDGVTAELATSVTERFRTSRAGRGAASPLPRR